MDPLSLLLGGGVGAGAAALLGTQREDRTEPTGLADLLAWGFLVDDGVVLLKDGGFLAGFAYRGPDAGSATSAELDALGAQLNDALPPCGDGWMFHADAIRDPVAPYPASTFPSPVPAWIDAERRAAIRSARQQFVTDHVLTVTYLPPRDVYARAARLFVRGGAPGADWRQLLDSYAKALDLFAARLAGRLQLARLNSTALVTHLHRCLTTLTHPVAAPLHGAYIDALLASQELVGGFAPRIGDRHLRCVAITGLPAATFGAQLAFLDSLPFAYRWSSRFLPVGTRTAATLIARQQRQWFMGRKGAGSLLREITGGDTRSERQQQQEEELFYNRDATQMAQDAAAAAAANASGAVHFGYATQVVVVAHESAALADANARAVLGALHDHGVTARIETVNALDAFFGTLPGHGTPNVRRPLLTTANIADLWPVTSVWPGLAENPSRLFPPHSPPLLHVATARSTPFSLNLHVGDVGHTLVVGATGAGKSTLLGLIAAQ